MIKNHLFDDPEIIANVLEDKVAVSSRIKHEEMSNIRSLGEEAICEKVLDDKNMVSLTNEKDNLQKEVIEDIRNILKNLHEDIRLATIEELYEQNHPNNRLKDIQLLTEDKLKYFNSFINELPDNKIIENYKIMLLWSEEDIKSSVNDPEILAQVLYDKENIEEISKALNMAPIAKLFVEKNIHNDPDKEKFIKYLSAHIISDIEFQINH